MKGLQNYQHNFCLARNLQRFWSQQLVLLWEGEGVKRPSRHFRAQTFVYINRKLIWDGKNCFSKLAIKVFYEIKKIKKITCVFLRWTMLSQSSRLTAA